MVTLLQPKHDNAATAAVVMTLLIDNYDSYTYNIYQMLAQVNGVAPVVVKNDDFGGDWQCAWEFFMQQVNSQWEAMKHKSTAAGIANTEPPLVECNVVLSPGPGHPEVPSDIGMCADAIRFAPVPVLGVCLGHQGMTHVYGGKVVNAKEVMHGRTSRIYYCEESDLNTTNSTTKQPLSSSSALFAFIPNGFEVVRYHSLVVDSQTLPSVLKVTAETYDGVIMAIEHRDKTQFGVQFHPEAICSEFGYQLFQNFRDLTLQQPATKCGLHHSGHHHLHVPVIHRRDALVAAQSDCLNDQQQFTVLVQRVSTGLASLNFAEFIFNQLFRTSRRSFWLDSSNYTSDSDHQSTSRFSFMGDNSGPLSSCVEFSVSQKCLRIHHCNGDMSIMDNADILTYIRTQMQIYSHHRVECMNFMSNNDLPFAFRGGFVGYFGYEVLGSGVDSGDSSANFLKNDMREALDEGEYAPDASLLFADRALIFDHYDEQIYVLTLCRSDNDTSSREWHRMMDQRLNALTQIFQSSSKSHPDTFNNATKPSPTPVVFHPSRSREQYVEDIHEIQRLIHAGETYEVCLTNQLRSNYSLKNPLQFYQLLRQRNPAPYAGFYLSNFDDWFSLDDQSVTTTPSLQSENRGEMAHTYAICCSSPERFLRVSSNGWMESKPIKGTRRRGLTATEDAEIADELAHCVKDRAENMMIADLVRNDFGIVAQVGSVHVPKLMGVESFATVHQLVTTVRGLKRDDVDVVDILKATFPGGSMTGAPKKRTMAIIRQLEQQRRGVYSGALGFISVDGSCDLNIIIRTAVITKHHVSVGAGGAIVALSDTHDEYEEMLLKTRALVQAIGMFATGKNDGATVEAAAN